MIYLELSLLLEEEECLLRLAGDLDLLFGGLFPPRLGDRLRPFPERLRRRGGERRRGLGERRRRGLGERRRRGEGERRRRGGDRRFGEGRRAAARGIRTGAAVISCPSICPPSICFIAFCASSGEAYSMYAKPLLNHGLLLSLPNSMSLIFPNVAKISSKCSLSTFLVSLPMCIFVGCGVPDLARGLRPLDLDLDADLFFLSLDLEGERFLEEGGEPFFLGGGETERLRGAGDPFLGGGELLRTGVPFFSTFLSESPFLSSFDFSPPFFFFPFFLSLDRDLLESELLELESLLLEELLELLCFLFFFDLSLFLDFLSSSLLLEEEEDEELRPLFFLSSSFLSALPAEPAPIFFK